MKVIVYHASYGCETGCCGHVVQVVGNDYTQKFHFEHPYMINNEEALKQWAKDLVEDTFGKDHTYDLDWENCNILDD